MLIAFLALLIGLTVGLLGAGGSIMAVPVLTYAAGMEPKTAIATSLLIVGTTSLFALVQHARRDHIDWRVGAVFAVAAMAGGFGGGLAAAWFSGSALLLIFASMMLVTAVAMLHGRDSMKRGDPRPIPVQVVVVEGLVVGAATGLVGAGGGFMIVPVLVLLGGMEMHKAVGTSLLIIALKSFAAYAGHATHVVIDFQLTAMVTFIAVVGSQVGALLALRTAAESLRKGFAAFVLCMACLIVWRETGPAAAGAVCLLALATLGALRDFARRRTPSGTGDSETAVRSGRDSQGGETGR